MKSYKIIKKDVEQKSNQLARSFPYFKLNKYCRFVDILIQLASYQVISQKTKNLANHKISKALVSDDVPIGDVDGARTALAQTNQSRIFAKIHIKC